MQRIHFLRPGQFVDMNGVKVELTAADLQAMAKAYDPALHEAPITIGHPEHDDPAYGWMGAVEHDPASGNYATPRDVAPALAEAVADGRYRKVSVALYSPTSGANPVPGVWYPRHLGFLGAMPPGVKGLRPVELADGETEQLTVIEVDVQFSEGEAEPGAPAKPEQEEPAMPDPNKPDAKTPETKAADEVALAEQRSKLDSDLVALSEREAALAKREADLHRRELGEKVDALIDDGRVLPRDRDAVIAFAERLEHRTDDEPEVVAFGEGDARTAQSLADHFWGYLEHQPKQVEFGERAAEETATATGVEFAAPEGYQVDAAQVTLHRQAKAYAAQHNVDFAVAVATISR